MLETKRVAAYGKRSTRIIYVSGDTRAPNGSPFAKNRVSRENTTSTSPVSVRKILTRGRKVHGLSTSPRGSPKSGNVLGLASKKPSGDPNALTPKRRPLGLKGMALPASPSIILLGKRPAQTPNAKLTPFAPFVDSDVVISEESPQVEMGRPKKVDKDRMGMSRGGYRKVIDEEIEAVRPPRLRAPKRPIVITDDEEDEDASTFMPSRRGVRANPIVVSDGSSDEYSKIIPRKRALKADALRSTKTQSIKMIEQPRPLVKGTSRRLQAEVTNLTTKPPLQPKPARGHGIALPSRAPTGPVSEHTLVCPRSPRRSQRNVSGPSQTRAQQPPSSTFDLERSFAALSISADIQPGLQGSRPQVGPKLKVPSPSTQHLAPLLKECGQQEAHCFSAFVETFPFDDLHGGNSSTGLTFRKIGEATYSEVFSIGDLVLKIVPLRNESPAAQVEGDVDPPQESEVKDVLQEVIVTRAMGQICQGFIKLLRTYVVVGTYPSLLLSLWDEFNEVKPSENIRPDVFPPTQAYALLVLPNGGPDLEAYTFPIKTGWRQACSVFWQIVKVLATAEELVSFEHRDLHWGQILVKGVSPVRTMAARTPRQRTGVNGDCAGDTGSIPMDHPSHGVTTTIIDLGLARMDAADGDGSGVHWTPFDELIFESEGDYQFEVYRMMQRHHGDTWDQYRPLTNVMWLHYLSLKLVHSKRLRPPGARNATTVTSEFGEKQCYECLLEMEQLLGTCIAQTKSKKSRVGWTKGSFHKAGDVVQFARRRGWLD